MNLEDKFLWIRVYSGLAQLLSQERLRTVISLMLMLETHIS